MHATPSPLRQTDDLWLAVAPRLSPWPLRVVWQIAARAFVSDAMPVSRAVKVVTFIGGPVSFHDPNVGR